MTGTAQGDEPVMIADMVWNMTGREICEAVCRQLRQRVFVRADAPLIGEIAA